MNPYNWHSFIYTMEQRIKKQNEKIKELEAKVKKLENNVQTLQDNSTPGVEKIEYHFDQLKIETLEGTLNIGLSPQGITSADELSIPTPNVGQQSVQNEQNPFVQQIQGELQPFLQNELPSKLREFANKDQKSFPPGFDNIIYQDIYRQLPARIEHYTRLHSENNNGIINSATKQRVLDDIKKEITHSIKQFIDGKGGL